MNAKLRRPPQRFIPSVALMVAAVTPIGCAGGMPLLHPAHTLRANEISAGAGMSGRILVGDAQELVRAQDAATEGSLGAGTATHAALAPGIAPWFAMRVGLGGALEGGLGYTGRATRADLRHSIASDRLALSLGLGGTALLSRRASHTSYSAVGGVDTNSTTGWGLDIPLLFGYRSPERYLELWVGPRGEFSRSITEYGVAARPADGTAPVEESARYGADVNQWSLSAVLGAALGLQPVWLCLEVQATHHWLNGKFDRLDGAPETLSMGAISLTPGAALRLEL